MMNACNQTAGIEATCQVPRNDQLGVSACSQSVSHHRYEPVRSKRSPKLVIGEPKDLQNRWPENAWQDERQKENRFARDNQRE
jgi:hypothetical protein